MVAIRNNYGSHDAPVTLGRRGLRGQLEVTNIEDSVMKQAL